MFYRLGRIGYRFRWLIVGIWLLLLALALPFLPRVATVLKVGGFSTSTIESARARQVLERDLDFAPVSMVVVFQSDTLRVSDPAYMAAMQRALEPVRALPEVEGIVYPFENPRQIAGDGRTAYAVVPLSLHPEESQRLVPDFRRLMPETELRTYLAGAPAFYADIETVSARDLQRAELVALPFAAITLLLVFRTVVGALVPLVVGGASVAVVLLLLYLVGQHAALSVFVLNLSTMLGLGLAIDYSLFLTSRFREELSRGLDVPDAVATTVATAGRAVVFSGLTVLIGLAGLLTFQIMFLYSVGVAGVIVVLLAVAGAVTLLPAILSILGHRLDRLRIMPEPADSGGFWGALAQRIMRRPWLFLLPTLLLLLALGSPFRHVRLSSPDASILPRDLEARQGYDILAGQYGEGTISPILIAVTSPDGPILTSEHVGALYDYTRRVQAVPGVIRVDSIVTLDERLTREQYQLMYTTPGAAPQAFDAFLSNYVGDRATMLSVVTAYPPNSPEARRLVERIRATPFEGDLTHLVDGGAAEITDIVNTLYSDVPRALALIVAATYVALLLLFRSVLLPLKAIVMNTLSILASYGALVWVFQDGNLGGLLNTTPLGYVEASLPILMFGTLFGLSMDYEVFLLSRVREAYDKTGDNSLSVAIGLQKSGRIITSAALIVVVVASSFVTADIVLVKALGLGIAIAVFIDTTIVRALLVPSTMELLGHLNWWAPAWLRRILPESHFVD